MAVFYQTEVYIKQHRIPRSNLQLTYSHDPINKPLGTAGSIKKTEKKIGHNSPFLALNGDIFADVNYTEIIKQHEKTRSLATLALHKVKDPSRFGVAELAKDNRITGFIEKPEKDKAPSNLINAGVYVLDPKIFNYIPENRTVSIEREIFPKLAERNQLYGYIHEGLWTDIGKPEDYMELNKTLLTQTTQTTQTKPKPNIKEPTILGKHASIGKNSTMGPYTIIGPDAIIGDNVRIINSILLPNVTVSDFALIEGAIIGEGVHIGKQVQIKKDCIIGDHARIKDRLTLAQKTHICPAAEVAESTLEPD